MKTHIKIKIADICIIQYKYIIQYLEITTVHILIYMLSEASGKKAD